MNNFVTTDLANGTVKSGGVLALGSSILSFADQYAVGIGILIAFLTLVTGWIFKWIDYRRDRRIAENTKRIVDIEKVYKKEKEINIKLERKLTAIEERQEKR